FSLSLLIIFLFYFIYPIVQYLLSLHDALPICKITDYSGKIRVGKTISFGHYEQDGLDFNEDERVIDIIEKEAKIIKLENGKKITDRKSTRLNSSHVSNSYAVFCLKKKNNKQLQ